MQCVCHHQFLVLLFMLNTQHDEINNFFCGIRFSHPRRHRSSDMGAISHHLRERRPGNEASLGAWLTRPQAFIIGVKEIRKFFTEFLVAPTVGKQNHGLKKPSGVTQMPFYGACIGHRLNALIFIRQTRNQVLGLSPQSLKVFKQIFVVCNFQKRAFNRIIQETCS